MSVLVRRFTSGRTAIEAKIALMRLKQLEREDVTELVERLSRLATMAYSDGERERERERAN